MCYLIGLMVFCVDSCVFKFLDNKILMISNGLGIKRNIEYFYLLINIEVLCYKRCWFD